MLPSQSHTGFIRNGWSPKRSPNSPPPSFRSMRNAIVKLPEQRSPGERRQVLRAAVQPERARCTPAAVAYMDIGDRRLSARGLRCAPRWLAPGGTSASSGRDPQLRQGGCLPGAKSKSTGPTSVRCLLVCGIRRHRTSIYYAPHPSKRGYNQHSTTSLADPGRLYSARPQVRGGHVAKWRAAASRPSPSRPISPSLCWAACSYRRLLPDRFA